MTEGPKDLEPSTTDGDQELTSLIEQCAAFDAAVEKLTPEERAARFAPKGIAPGATEEEFERALEAELLADPAILELANDVEASTNLVIGTLLGQKPTLDEKVAAALVSSLKHEYTAEDPAARRAELLQEYNLPATSSDDELGQAARKEVEEYFASPVRQDLADQIVNSILKLAKVS